MLVTKKLKSLVRSTVNMVVRAHQVCVTGGASEIGQVVCMLLRAEPAISRLVVHDLHPGTAGIVQDLSHIPVHSILNGYCGEDTLERALKNSDLIIFTGGSIPTPGLTKQACLQANTEFIKTVASKVGKLSPMPFVAIAMDPINILVPMAAEIMRYNGEFEPKKLLGVTTIDWLRAQTLFAAEHSLSPHSCFVPVIGGHSDRTTVPLISHSRPATQMTENDIIQFTTKIQNYDDIVTQAKLGFSPTMSIAYSVLMFTREILSALEGRHVQANAFVDNNDFGTSYFSGLVNIDKDGVKDMQRYSNLSQYECQLLEKATNQLRKDVAYGKKVLEMV